MQERIKRDHNGKVKLSKELMDMKRQVHILIATKQIEEAEGIKRDCDIKEANERAEVDRQVEELLVK